jgi:hypothetical protein
MRPITVGSTVVPNELHRVPCPGNEDGMGIPAFNDALTRIGFVKQGFPLLCIEDVQTTFVKVLGPVGPVWVMKKHLKHL